MKIALLSFLLLQVIPPADVPAPIRSTFTTALERFQQGQLDEAHALLENCLEVSTDSYSVHHLIGIVSARLNRLEQAQQSFQAALRIRPGDYASVYNLALVYQRADKHEQGILLLKNQIGRETETDRKAEAHRLLATLYQEKGEVLEATRHLYEALKVVPSEENFFNLGSQLLGHMAYGEAEKFFRQGSRRFPKSPRLLLGLGSTLALQDRPDQAALAFLKAAALEPQSRLPYDYLNLLPPFVFATGEAASHLEQTLQGLSREHPQHGILQYLAARSSFRRRQALEASVPVQQIEVQLKKALELSPDLHDALYVLALLYLHSDRLEAAVTSLERAVALNPKEPLYHYQLGQALVQSGELARAEKELQRFEQLKSTEEEDLRRRHKLLKVLALNQ